MIENIILFANEHKTLIVIIIIFLIILFVYCWVKCKNVNVKGGYILDGLFVEDTSGAIWSTAGMIIAGDSLPLLVLNGDGINFVLAHKDELTNNEGTLTNCFCNNNIFNIIGNPTLFLFPERDAYRGHSTFRNLTGNNLHKARELMDKFGGSTPFHFENVLGEMCDKETADKIIGHYKYLKELIINMHDSRVATVNFIGQYSGNALVKPDNILKGVSFEDIGNIGKMGKNKCKSEEGTKKKYIAIKNIMYSKTEEFNKGVVNKLTISCFNICDSLIRNWYKEDLDWYPKLLKNYKVVNDDDGNSLIEEVPKTNVCALIYDFLYKEEFKKRLEDALSNDEDFTSLGFPSKKTLKKIMELKYMENFKIKDNIEVVERSYSAKELYWDDSENNIKHELDVIMRKLNRDEDTNLTEDDKFFEKLIIQKCLQVKKLLIDEGLSFSYNNGQVNNEFTVKLSPKSRITWGGLYEKFYTSNSGSCYDIADIYPAQKVIMFIWYACHYLSFINSKDDIQKLMDGLAAYMIYVHLFNSLCGCQMELSWNRNIKNAYVYNFSNIDKPVEIKFKMDKLSSMSNIRQLSENCDTPEKLEEALVILSEEEQKKFFGNVDIVRKGKNKKATTPKDKKEGTLENKYSLLKQQMYETAGDFSTDIGKTVYLTVVISNAFRNEKLNPKTISSLISQLPLSGYTEEIIKSDGFIKALAKNIYNEINKPQ